MIKSCQGPITYDKRTQNFKLMVILVDVVFSAQNININRLWTFIGKEESPFLSYKERVKEKEQFYSAKTLIFLWKVRSKTQIVTWRLHFVNEGFGFEGKISFSNFNKK